LRTVAQDCEPLPCGAPAPFTRSHDSGVAGVHTVHAVHGCRMPPTRIHGGISLGVRGHGRARFPFPEPNLRLTIATPRHGSLIPRVPRGSRPPYSPRHSSGTTSSGAFLGLRQQSSHPHRYPVASSRSLWPAHQCRQEGLLPSAHPGGLALNTFERRVDALFGSSKYASAPRSSFSTAARIIAQELVAVAGLRRMHYGLVCGFAEPNSDDSGGFSSSSATHFLGRVEERRGFGCNSNRPVSLPRSSNRTGLFRASGFPTDFTSSSRTARPIHVT